MAIRTFEQGAAAIKQAAAAHTNIGKNNCKIRTRQAFNVPSNGSGTAYKSWMSIAASEKHPTSDPGKIPDNCFVYFSGGSEGDGHVGVMIDGQFYTPGGPANDHIWYATTIAAVLRGWPNLRLAGWSYVIDSQIPARPAAPAPKPKKVPMNEVISNTQATFKVATNNIMSLPENPEVHKTLKAAPLASVVMIQEADLADFHKAIKNVNAHRIAPSVPDGDTYDSFVLYDPAIWDHVSTKFKKTYDGVAKISKTRRLAITILRHKGIDEEVAFLSDHAVTAGKDKVRKRLRKEGKKVIRTELKKLKKKGMPIVFGTDQNSTKNIFKSRKFRIPHRLDSIYIWDGDHVKFSKNGHHTVATRSDHDVLVVGLTATKKG